MNNLSVPIVRAQRVGDFGLVDVEIGPCAVVEKDDFAELVVRVKRVERGRDGTCKFILAFVFVLIVIKDGVVMAVFVGIVGCCDGVAECPNRTTPSISCVSHQ